ncbi:MAG: HAD-IA family hydrolase [Thioalkalivibrionaceae bacterium]
MQIEVDGVHPDGREPRLIVFDWDGTLMDSTARIVSCLRAATETLGETLCSSAEYRDIIGLGVVEATRRLFPQRAADHDFVEAFAQAYRSRYLNADSTPTPMYDGAIDLVRGLAERPDTLVAVATGKSRTGLDQALKTSGLQGVFFATATSSEHPSKPSPTMLEWLLEKSGVEPAAATMIGDSRYDIEMAVAAGVRAVGVTHGVHDAPTLMSAGAAEVFDDLGGVSRYIKATFSRQ